MSDNTKAGIRKRVEKLRAALIFEGYSWPNDLLILADELVEELGGESINPERD